MWVYLSTVLTSGNKARFWLWLQPCTPEAVSQVAEESGNEIPDGILTIEDMVENSFMLRECYQM